MECVKWMNFSGAPPILIPRGLVAKWNGFYVPAAREDDEFENEFFDLVLADGRKFDVHDEFDFDHPQTDYDRLCAEELRPGRPPGPFLFPVASGQALVISDESEGPVAWWPERQMIVTVGPQLPDPGRLDDLVWREDLHWRIDERRLYLMNACLHGADPHLLESDEAVEVELEPGEYLVASADYTHDVCLKLYRLSRL